MFNFKRRKAKFKEATYVAVMTVKDMFDGIFASSARPSNYLSIGTVYSCIRMLSDSVAMTPVKVYKAGTSGRELQENHAITALLKKPAKNVTYFQWQNAMMGQLSGWGNGYSVIEYDGITPKSLIFIPTQNVMIQETFSDSEPYYYIVTLKSGKTINVFPDEMIHYRNITIDGFTGLSPIGLHAMTFDRAYYESQFATNFMKNGGSMSGIITTDKKLKKEQVETLKTDFASAYSGSENAGKTPVLGDGLQYTQLSPISPADADYVRSKQLTKSDIMEIFKVPPPLLGVMDTTYSNTEQLSLIYQRYTLAPLYTMIEQELSLKLIIGLSDIKTYAEFEADALLNATASDKAEVITKLTEKGVMTLNEARKKYNLKDIDGLDEVILPLNLAPMELHKEVLTPVEPPVPVVVEEPTPPKENDEKEDEDLKMQIQKIKSELGRLKKDLGNVDPESGTSNPKNKSKGKV